VFTVLVSLAAPIDRAIEYFRIVAAVFSVFTILSIVGISIFLLGTGFYPPVKQYNPTTEVWEDLDEPPHFSILTLSGTIMLSIYLIPIILRPVDFIFNFPQYCIGLVSYLLLLPTFINVMQIYSMSNLHDISWGNRPSVTAGTDALSANAAKQQQLKSNYMVFRVNFLTWWVVANAAFAITIENYAQLTNTKSTDGGPIIVNDGSIGFLEIFAAYLAALVVYKVSFGVIHLLKFKIYSNFVAKYKCPKYDLHEEVKRLR
jgi:hypothetical protein